MIRLNRFPVSYDDVLSLCVEGITGDVVLHNEVVRAKDDLLAFEERYIEATRLNHLWDITPPILSTNEDITVISNLSKKDLVKLYENYLRGKSKPARKIYDQILASAKSKCPFCGGIGRPRNLDHFLPKAYFPQFSVMPINLVPACRDCNMDGKGADYAKSQEQLIIQPYLDEDKFFSDPWISARYFPPNGQEGYVEYYVTPPENWSVVDQARAEKHFKDFDLYERYSIQAGSELSYVEPDLDKIVSGEMQLSDFILNCEEKVERAPFINSWKGVMYKAMMQYAASQFNAE